MLVANKWAWRVGFEHARLVCEYSATGYIRLTAAYGGHIRQQSSVAKICFEVARLLVRICTITSNPLWRVPSA